MMNRYVRLFVVSSLIVGASACSVMDDRSKGRRVSGRASREVSAISPAEPMPWEIWQPFYDQRGERLTNASLLLGDEMLRKGKRRAALDAYLKASATTLTDSEAEAAALRTASQYLALDESARSLSTISTYFKKRGMGESEVNTSFSLLLAFAYGRHGDTEQALAWFSKANRQAQRGERTGVQASATGAAQFLRLIPNDMFETVALDWSADPFVNELVGRERMRRAAAGSQKDSIDRRRPFWEASAESLAIAEPPKGNVVSKESPVVGVLLSLSDKFGALGRDTKQGFDLAVEADKNGPSIRLEVRDVGSDTAAASAAVRELATTARPSIIVGPLLTDVSVSAAESARELRIPLLSFSKSESFELGGGISRLGATTTSQIEAIVNASHNDLGISQYAIVYPESANGSEVLSVFKKKLSMMGIAPVLEAPYVAGDEASILEAAQRLDSAGAQAVLIPDTLEVAVKILSNVSNATRLRMRPLGTALWDNPVKVANSQALFNKALFVTPFFPQSLRPVVQQFNESYKGKFKTVPNFLAAQGFDAGTLVVAALRRAAQEGVTFTDAFAKLPPYEGVTGAIRVEPSGEVRRAFYVVEVTPSGFVERFPGTTPSAAASSALKPITQPSTFLSDEERVESGY